MSQELIFRQVHNLEKTNFSFFAVSLREKKTMTFNLNVLYFGKKTFDGSAT